MANGHFSPLCSLLMGEGEEEEEEVVVVVVVVVVKGLQEEV